MKKEIWSKNNLERKKEKKKKKLNKHKQTHINSRDLHKLHNPKHHQILSNATNVPHKGRKIPQTNTSTITICINWILGEATGTWLGQPAAALTASASPLRQELWTMNLSLREVSAAWGKEENKRVSAKRNENVHADTDTVSTV